MFQEFMIEKKKTQTVPDYVVCDKIGISHSLVGKWRRGNTLSLKSFNKVMKYYKVEKTYAKAMWEDIVAKRQETEDVRTLKAPPRLIFADEANISREFYELENELIEKYGSMRNVPENNKKLRKIREMVGVV